MILFSNDYFELIQEDSNVKIKVLMSGFLVKDFSDVAKQVMRFKLTNFTNLNQALTLQTDEPPIIGIMRDKVEVTVSKDGLEVWGQVLVTPETYQEEETQLKKRLIEKLAAEKVVFGLLTEVLKQPLALNDKFLIARGLDPINGEDAMVTYYAFSDKKPQVLQNGAVNHYELNLIDNVSTGEWLGERRPPTPGKEGLTVYNEPIPAQPGKDKKLSFDQKTVEKATKEDGLEVLYAKRDGAVKMIGGKISVDNHLKINGDVDYTTGNIDFDGYVTVTGTVKDGFSVVAANDITINGNMGVGAVDLIKSKHGSIFIRGGINGKTTARVQAGKNVYLKYANEAILQADNIINIGFYAMDSDLKASKVIVNPKDGRVIGGKIDAAHQIMVGTIGNKSERKTDVHVKGFERCDVKDRLDAILIQYKDLLTKSNKIKRQIEILEDNVAKLDDRGMNTLKGMLIQHEHLMNEITRCNDEVERCQETLKTRGDGEVIIQNMAYPKTFLEIKSLQKRIKEGLSGSFYVQNNDLHYEF